MVRIDNDNVTSSLRSAMAKRARWRYGVMLSNSFLVFGVYYFMPIPVSLQNEMTNSADTYIGSNSTKNQINCTVCLGLGEVRYNLLFSTTRWASVAVCLPSGLVIDRLGNGCSALLFTTLVFLGSILFTVGATSHPPVTTPMYILMVIGYGFMAFGDVSLRLSQGRIISHYFQEETLTAVAFSFLAHFGDGLTFFTTPLTANALGIQYAIWLGSLLCGISVLSAVLLALLLHLQPHIIEEKTEDKNTLTLAVVRALPGSFWLFTLALAFTIVSWLVKHANLPEYLELRHGYTMSEASHISAIAGCLAFITPFLCWIVKKIDCDGITYSFFQLLLLSFYFVLGFCPRVNIIFVSVVDGIGIFMATAISWQLIVVLCPPSSIGILSGFVYMARNTMPALTFIASGYILKSGKVTNIDDALGRYQNFFFMLISLSIIGVIFGILMNAADIREGGSLNSRIRRWKNSDMESLGLISMGDLSNTYCGSKDTNEGTNELPD
ncbi:uncharacterized protein [Argopecten irradians]|uniref:uncharacterized protein n=1 Tax=Argopecten irradians TaxID=31199 RepID=UPI003716A7DC